jgi:hypothetical protein
MPGQCRLTVLFFVHIRTRWGLSSPNSLPSSFSSPSAYLKCETLEPVKKVKASKTLFSVQRGTWGGNYSSVIIVLFTIAAFEVVSEATLSKCRSFLSPTGRSGRCQTVAGYSCRCMLLPKLRFWYYNFEMSF